MNRDSALSFKIILIGDSGTGKTSLIRKYIHGVFKDEYEVTVGVDFSSKIVTINNEPVQLQIWDTCGQDIYKSITTNFFKGAAAVFLVYSVDNRASFQSLTQWLSDFYEKGSSEAFIFLIGTKCDLQAQVEQAQAFQFMKKIKGVFFIQTSAKSDSKVTELFFKAAETLYKYYQVSSTFKALVRPERNSFPLDHYVSNASLPESQEMRSNLKEGRRRSRCCQ